MFHIATDESLDVWRGSPTLLTFLFNLAITPEISHTCQTVDRSRSGVDLAEYSIMDSSQRLTGY